MILYRKLGTGTEVSHFYKWRDECKILSIQWGLIFSPMKLKPPADRYRANSIKIQTQIRRANLILVDSLKWIAFFDFKI